MTVDTEELERLEREATAAPWSIKTYQDESGEHNPFASWDLWSEENMALVCAMRNSIGDLLRELRELRGKLAESERQLMLARAALDGAYV